MARKWYAGRKIKGLKTDTKPTQAEIDTEFEETDTGNKYKFDGTNWKFSGDGKIASGDTKPTNVVSGSTILETDTLKTFDYNGSAWVERSGGGATQYTTLNPMNSTIGDYTTPTTSASSSVATPATSGTTSDSNGSNNSLEYIAGGDTSTSSVKRNSTFPSSYIGKRVYQMGWYGNRNSWGSWNGSYTLQIKNSSGVVQITSPTTKGTNITVENSKAWQYFDVTTGGASGTGYEVQSGDYMYIQQVGGGNGTASAIYVGGASGGNWNYNNIIDDQIQYVADHVKDNGYGNDSITKTQAEVNPNISVGLGSSQEIQGCAIYLDSGNTETIIEIQTSPDNSTWTTKRTILASKMTAGQWNFIALNNVTAEYIRIYGNSGTSKVLSVTEFKYLVGSLNDNHGHIVIDSTDTSLGLDGI